MACKGEWQKWRLESPFIVMEQKKIPLTEEQKHNQDMISVCIPIREHDFKYLSRTIDSVKKNAVGKIEVIVFADGFTIPENFRKDVTILCNDYIVQGQRIAMNHMAKIAKGKYLFRLDGHCLMSPEWDARLKLSMGKEKVVTTIFGYIDEDMNIVEGRECTFVLLNETARSQFVRPWIKPENRNPEEKQMGLSGCAWLIEKDYYNQIGGHDEYLTHWGGIGSEIALKTWTSGGQAAIRTDVVCYHLFRTKTPFENTNLHERSRTFRFLKEKYIDVKGLKRNFNWLRYQFPEWSNFRPLVFIKDPSEEYDNAVI